MVLPSRSSSSTVIPWPENLVYETLIGYNNWSQWLPSMKSSRLLMKEDTLAIVELGFDVPGEETLMMESIHTLNKVVLGRVIEGSSPAREIRWDLEPAGSGGTKVTLSMKRHIRRYLSRPAYWPILNPALCLGALRTWMAEANPGPEISKAGENLFELWETDEGLVCWIRGRKYALTPSEEKRS
jgi:hypothetical protein